MHFKKWFMDIFGIGRENISYQAYLFHKYLISQNFSFTNKLLINLK